MRRLLLMFVVRLTIRAPVLVLSACALLTGIAATRALSLFPIETNLLSLLPRNSPEALTYSRSVLQFGSFDYMIVVVESADPGQQETLIKVATYFARAVREGRYIEAVDYAPDSEARENQLPEIDERKVPALLTDTQLAHLDRALHQDLDRRLHRLRLELDLPISAAHRKALLRDPIGLERIVRLDRFRPRGPIQNPNESGLAISEDGQMLLMVIKPSRPATDMLFSEELMKWLRNASRYAIESGGPEASGCRIGFIGSHAEAEKDAFMVRRDLAAMLVVSFVLVVLLFILAVRRIGAIFFVGAPLAVGVIWTLGAATWFFDRISVVTCLFGAALIALGIDYAIHIYNRYLEERLDGAAVNRALETALCETGRGVLVCALTAAVGFYGMYFTRFEGLQELAIIGGAGILSCLLAMLFVLPPLVVLSERARARLGLQRSPSSLGLGRLAATVQTYPRLTLTVGLIVTACLGYSAESIKFDDDVRHLREQSAEYEDLIRRTANRFALPATQAIAIVSAPTFEEALDLNDRLYRHLEEAGQYYPILGYDSLRTVLPSTRTQLESQAKLRAFLNRNGIDERLRVITKREDLATTVVSGLHDQMKRWKATATEENLIRFAGGSSPAFAQLVGRYVYRHKERCRIVTHIYPRQGEWEDRVPDDFVAYLNEDIASLEITGLTFVSSAIKRLLISGMAWAVILVALTVFLLLIVHFWSVRKAAVAVIPVLCSIVWTLGTMQLLGINLTFLNIIVIPLLLGLGIDDGVHILERYYEGGRHDLESAVEQSGRAIVVTSLTTMLAFGTMSLASFPGVREIGIVAVFGVGFALIASILFVPALLQLAGEHLRLIDLLGGTENRRTK